MEASSREIRSIPSGIADDGKARAPVPRGVAVSNSFKGCGGQKRDRCGRTLSKGGEGGTDDRVARERGDISAKFRG